MATNNESVLARRKRPELRHLTGLRIIAALWVVAFHFSEPFEQLVPELSVVSYLHATGYLAVDLFFVLSGFILAYQYLERFPNGRGDYLGFLVKRLARIYPTQVFTLAALVVVVVGASVVGINISDPQNFTTWGAVQDVLLIRGWFVPTQGWNFPSWSLSAEWFAYLLFPLVCAVVLAVVRRSEGWLYAVIVLMVGVEATADVLWPSFNGMPIPLVRVTVAFVCGVAVYRLGVNRPSTSTASWIGLSALVGLIIGTTQIPRGGGLAAAALSLCIITVAGLARGRGFITRALGSRVMEYGGQISFGVYMWHGIALMLVVRLVNTDRWADAPLVVRLLLVLAELALVLVGGAALFHFVEKPSQRWIVRRFHDARAARQRRRAGAVPDPVV